MWILSRFQPSRNTHTSQYRSATSPPAFKKNYLHAVANRAGTPTHVNCSPSPLIEELARRTFTEVSSADALNVKRIQSIDVGE